MPEQGFRFRIPGAQWQIEFCGESLRALGQHVQHGFNTVEVAGQLFTRDINGPVVRVDKVTNPVSRWARYAGVRLDLKVIQKERDRLFREGLHCLGFWHSHPEACPSPSHADLALAAEQAVASGDDFTGLIFVIIGYSPFPKGLGVWVHDGTQLWRAEHIEKQG
ncbi:Mov34/MPN/PAD-1 family protein [Pseudomonas syringae pv. syringae]|uniref:Mov34/MPN/PAD-1 family protein n=1 Tax=Pseudomonas syringae pv. syringae TaxID=321 RepID=A0AB35JMT5_PSESY|nr:MULTISPECIES: Mov34/MPN/PAD-1 family protein [Pseudomonas syringae group]MDC3735232.1 Mov34/MPN/PAD-1 family protein [Pseudomonas syringae pv. syringae]